MQHEWKPYIFLISILLLTAGEVSLSAQEVNTGIKTDSTTLFPTMSIDSLSLVQEADSLANHTALPSERFIPNSARSTWLALVFPGGGQIYNRKYWKLPIIYGGFVGCIYALSWNGSMYNDYSQAYELMRTEFPKFLKRASFQPDNIVWCAGFHTNTDHRHIHFSFYEKQPLRYRKNKSELCFSHEQVSVASINSMKIKTNVFSISIQKTV